MIRGEVQYGGRHAAALAELAREMPRINRETAEELAQAVREAHRIARLAGRDADGVPLRPVSVRIGKYAGASGAPIVPHGESSGAIQNAFVNVVQATAGFTIVAGIRGRIAQILRWHAEGKSGKGRPITRDGKLAGFRGIRGATTGIRRNVFGLGPADRAGVRAVFAKQPRRIGQKIQQFARRAAAFFGSL